MFQSYQSKQINPDENSLVENLNSLCGFNRINPNRSILTQEEDWKKDRWYQGFNRINPNRSIPTRRKLDQSLLVSGVSIVSIQTDQSRRVYRLGLVWLTKIVSIVSIQTDQSRPDLDLNSISTELTVSIVSIQTDQSRHYRRMQIRN